MAEETATHPNTPWNLWVVGILLLLWHALSVFDYMATVFRFEFYLSGFSEELLEYYFAVPLWMYILWFMGATGGFIGAILLLMRNKLVIPIFAAGYVASIIANGYSFINPPPEQVANPMFILVILLIAALVLLYCMWLKNKGVLR